MADTQYCVINVSDMIHISRDFHKESSSSNYVFETLFAGGGTFWMGKDDNFDVSAIHDTQD